jgi:lipopolysaccharide biosynthesis glycosyltransferase
MPHAKPLNIVVVSDNHYIVLLAALIKSVEENLRPDQQLHFHIVEDNVSTRNKEKLLKSINVNITKLSWKSMATVVPEGVKLPFDRGSFPLNIYMRLFIPYFLPKEMKTVLYLDVDMIVLTDITKLFEIDLNNCVIGAVLDPRIITFDNSWGGILNFNELGLLGTTRYFNTGLLLIDTLKWREQNIAGKVIKCIDENIKFANYPDQYGMNVVLANQWLGLNPLWNHFSTIDTNEKPFLIHFVERKPIYQSYNSNEEFKKIFYQYLNQTQWKNFKPIGELKRYFKKLKNILYKLFRIN